MNNLLYNDVERLLGFWSNEFEREKAIDELKVLDRYPPIHGRPSVLAMALIYRNRINRISTYLKIVQFFHMKTSMRCSTITMRSYIKKIGDKLGNEMPQ